MTDSVRHRRIEQRRLFNPPRVLPTWTDLPASVREPLVKLVVEMLLDHSERCAAIQREVEAGDE